MHHETSYTQHRMEETRTVLMTRSEIPPEQKRSNAHVVQVVDVRCCEESEAQRNYNDTAKLRRNNLFETISIGMKPLDGQCTWDVVPPISGEQIYLKTPRHT